MSIIPLPAPAPQGCETLLQPRRAYRVRKPLASLLGSHKCTFLFPSPIPNAFSQRLVSLPLTPQDADDSQEMVRSEKPHDMSSGHDKKARRAATAGKQGIIAAPPRAALSGRSKAEASSHDDSASTKSAADGNNSGNGNGNGSEAEEAEPQDGRKRIAALEKELATQAAEFERELAQLGKKMMEESETARFWQQKHSQLNQTFLKADTELRLLRQEADSARGAREERERDVKTRISSLMLDRDAFREAYNEAMGDLRTKEDTIRELQGQVWGLKSFVSTSSKMDEQVTDEAFGEQMQRLGNSIQNWVITNFRRAKISTSISFALLNWSPENMARGWHI